MRESINRTTVMIVLAIFLSISVGYALFSDTITIEGTATAQGNFDIKASCITDVTPDLLTNFGVEVDNYKEHGYKNISCGENDDKVTYSVSFDYPDAVKYYVIKMENVGGTSAYFNINDLIEEKTNVNIIKKYDLEGSLIETINSKDLDNWGQKAFIRFDFILMTQNTNGEYFPLGSEGFIADFATDNDEIVLESGESIYLLMKSFWPNEEEFLENNVKYEVTGTFEIDWQQYTE